MAEQLVNRSTTFLTVAVNNSTSILTVSSTFGFPNVGNFRVRVEAELMLVSAVNGLNWTVQRGIEGTTKTSHLVGAKVTVVLTAGGLTQYIAEQIAASH